MLRASPGQPDAWEEAASADAEAASAEAACFDLVLQWLVFSAYGCAPRNAAGQAAEAVVLCKQVAIGLWPCVHTLPLLLCVLPCMAVCRVFAAVCLCPRKPL